MFRRSDDGGAGGLFPEVGQPPILIVEDDEGLALLMEESLQGLSLECARAATGSETLQWFDSQRSGFLLLDYSLPDMTGLEVLNRLEERGKRQPFIVTTGVGDEKLAVEMMKRGARDYLVKDKEFLAALPATVSRVLRELRGEEELRRVREDLERSRALYQTMVKAATGVSFILTENEGGESRIREFSPGAEALFGYGREELLGMRVQELYSPGEFPLVERFFQERAGRGERLEGEATLKEKQFILQVIKRFIRISYGERDPQDPDYFGQSENISERFMNTAAYNAFLLSLFDPPENAMEFLTHILPDGLRARAQEQLPIPDMTMIVESPVTEEKDPEQPLYIRENRAATQSEVQNMSREELLQAMAFRQTLGQ